MFSKLEKKKRQKLIFLFDQFILKGNFEDFEPLVDDVTFDSGCSGFSKIVNAAGLMIEDAKNKGISIKDARSMLENLKSPH